MTRNAILYDLVLMLPVISSGCSGNRATTTTSNTETNANVKAAIAVNNSAFNSTLNVPPPSPVANSAVPDIPNAPANLAIAKSHPTRNAKMQIMTRQAPDNSEISQSLGEKLIETRVFKNNSQIAKVERIMEDAVSGRKTVKIYLRNGQVRELPEGKVGDVMAESAANIMRAVAANGTDSKPTTSNEAKTTPTTQANVAESTRKQQKKSFGSQ